MSLVFYDTETTGVQAPFDQILQFAAIRTDSDLNEVDRFQIRSRLLPHIVPSPSAISVNGITVRQLTDKAISSHYDMVRAIRTKLLSWSPCNFVGYNSIGFDEHFVRQALYQTLHAPYLTNCDGNTRSDVMRMLQASALFSPGAVKIPIDANGQAVFKLDRVAPENGFAHSNAHDAMADVEATIFLSRLVNERAPDVWSAAMRFSKKAAVADYVENEPVISLSDFYFGKAYSWLVTFVGVNTENSSEIYVYNLAIEPKCLTKLPLRELGARLQESPKPIRSLRSNAAPILMSGADAPDIASGVELGLPELERRAEVVRANPEFRGRLVAAFEAAKEEREVSAYVEEQIYDEFIPGDDVRVMEEFHRVPWERRLSVLGKLKDARLRQLGRQLIHTERPEALDETTRRDCDVTRAMRLIGTADEVPWLTLPKALKEVDDMISADTQAAARLGDYRTYLLERLEFAKATAACRN
jgi:exodeoxyribonuclease-1